MSRSADLVPDGTSARLLRGCVEHGVKRGGSSAVEVARRRPRWREVVRRMQHARAAGPEALAWRGGRECNSLVAAKPGGARAGGSCQVNATCSTWRPRGARCGGMLSERSWREQQARGRPRWRELPGERSACDLRTRMRSRWRGGRERNRLVAVSPGAPAVAGVVR
jgi:hypothetical protein